MNRHKSSHSNRILSLHWLVMVNGTSCSWAVSFLCSLLVTHLFSERVYGEDDFSFFEQNIRPVLIAECYACHSEQADKVKGGLLLDSAQGWRRGGDSGDSVIIPHDSENSMLLQSLRHQNGLAMPPDKQLSEKVIADFDAWIDSGAPDPRTNDIERVVRADKTWWSLQPLASPMSPTIDTNRLPSEVSRTWLENPIDRFILDELLNNHLAPSAPADPRVLIRRMSYDVTGLPPTFGEVNDFIRDYAQDADAAVNNLADRLLASKHYGEQWGRHWLDVVRFGESNGYERNFIINDLWPFRDYVISSINNDKPFDQFIKEHLAGDAIGPGQPEMEIGSAFLVAGPYDDVGNQDIVAQANIRAATLDDIVTTTSAAFLGLTINCARCHDHKFDPIPAEDYYRLRSAFEGIVHGRRVVATPDQISADRQARADIQSQLDQTTAELVKIDSAIQASSLELISRTPADRPKFDPFLTEESFEPVAAKYLKVQFVAHTDNPASAIGSRLTEVQVWDSTHQINVALQSQGTIAEGAKSAVAEDFEAAYSVSLINDDARQAQWFIGAPAELVLQFPAERTIDRVVFTNSRDETVREGSLEGATPCEYEIFVSKDGEQWNKVGDSFTREAWSQAHSFARLKRLLSSTDSGQEKGPAHDALRSLYRQRDSVSQQIAELHASLASIPPLPQVWVGTRVQPAEPTRKHQGGDPMKPTDVVAPSSLEVLNGVAPAYALAVDTPESERRMALADWITSRDNPLTPRVLANRIWQHHFGTGIVDTPNDFGFLGSQPTHPALLDFLAQQLLENGWQIKPIHRLILTSQTYRQSAAAQPAGIDKDSDTRLLWRFPPRRLSAEELRDSMLAVSGLLREDQGGPGFRLYKHMENNVSTYSPLEQHGPETFRRAVYHQNVRASIVDLLSDFDQPDNSFSAAKRTATTSPLQALTLLNHDFTSDVSQALAQRVTSELPSEFMTPESVSKLFEFVLQRSATPDEIQICLPLVEQFGLPALARALVNSSEFLTVE